MTIHRINQTPVELRSGNNAIYGDGSDGNVVISSNTTLTTDMYYNNLTINAGVILNTNGFRVFVKNTLTINGAIGIGTISGSTIGEPSSTATTGTLSGASSSTTVTYSLGGRGGGGSAGTVGTISASYRKRIEDIINGVIPTSSGYSAITGGSAGTTGSQGHTAPVPLANASWSGKPGTAAPTDWPGKLGVAGAAGNAGNPGTGATDGGLGGYPPDSHTVGVPGGRGHSGNNGAAGAAGTAGSAGNAGNAGNDGNPGTITNATVGPGGAGGSGGVGGPVVVVVAKTVLGSGKIVSIGRSGGSGSAGNTGIKGDDGNNGNPGAAGTGATSGGAGGAGGAGAAGSAAPGRHQAAFFTNVNDSHSTYHQTYTIHGHSNNVAPNTSRHHTGHHVPHGGHVHHNYHIGDRHNTPTAVVPFHNNDYHSHTPASYHSQAHWGASPEFFGTRQIPSFYLISFQSHEDGTHTPAQHWAGGSAGGAGNSGNSGNAGNPGTNGAAGPGGAKGVGSPAVTGGPGKGGGSGGGGGVILVTDSVAGTISYDTRGGLTDNSDNFSALSGYSYVILN